MIVIAYSYRRDNNDARKYSMILMLSVYSMEVCFDITVDFIECFYSSLIETMFMVS
jgi:hypothetical protein